MRYIKSKEELREEDISLERINEKDSDSLLRSNEKVVLFIKESKIKEWEKENKIKLVELKEVDYLRVIKELSRNRKNLNMMGV